MSNLQISCCSADSDVFRYPILFFITLNKAFNGHIWMYWLRTKRRSHGGRSLEHHSKLDNRANSLCQTQLIHPSTNIFRCLRSLNKLLVPGRHFAMRTVMSAEAYNILKPTGKSTSITIFGLISIMLEKVPPFSFHEFVQKFE